MNNDNENEPSTIDRINSVGSNLLLYFIGVGISGFLISFLWNVTMSPIFGIATITFFQGVFLRILVDSLFYGVAR